MLPDELFDGSTSRPLGLGSYYREGAAPWGGPFLYPRRDSNPRPLIATPVLYPSELRGHPASMAGRAGGAVHAPAMPCIRVRGLRCDYGPATTTEGVHMAERDRNYNRQLVIRVDDELLDEIKHDAEANGRTVAQTVRFRLAQQLRPLATSG